MKEANIICQTGNINWNLVPMIAIDYLHNTPSTDVKAFAQVCYDDQALYLRLSAHETEIRAEEKGLLGMPCTDSCLEFFFSPMENDLRYFNLEFNPNKCLFLGFGSGIDDLVRLVISEEEQAQLFNPQVTYLPDGWAITYQIPYSFIRRFFPDFAVIPGKTIRANFYKCAPKATPKHSLTWNPITPKKRSSFHAPEEYGVLKFI